MIRQPIVMLAGHVDHGKSSLLEKIKGISIVKAEPGAITQSIKSYNVPLKTIKKITGKLLDQLKIKLTIQGLLFLDTPGHAAFNNLRKRGGNLADIAILVIDVTKGIEEQTKECIQILKQYKTPFVIALNKIDLIPGWNRIVAPLLQEISQQPESVKLDLDNRLYTIVGKLTEFGLNSERFDRVEDYRKQVAIIPVSAKTGEGLPELLMVITGLAQKFLEEELKIEVKGPGKAIVLEVRKEKGLGECLDVVLYDGTMKTNDQFVVGDINEPKVGRIKALFEFEKGKVTQISEVHASIGVKVNCKDVENILPGMPLMIVKDNLEELKKEIKKEVQEVIVYKKTEGIIVKADTLGSLEALTNLLKEKGIKIKSASIGEITKKDITEALTQKDELNRIILCFNIPSLETQEVKIISNEVIYRLIEDYEKWLIEAKKELETKVLKSITPPAKIKILKRCIFRKSNPAIVGITVILGNLRNESILINEEGKKIGIIRGIQKEKKNINELKESEEAAISLPDAVVGRHIFEDQVLYTDVNEEGFKELKKLKSFLNHGQIEVLKEIINIKRTKNPLWGI